MHPDKQIVRARVDHGVDQCLQVRGERYSDYHVARWHDFRFHYGVAVDVPLVVCHITDRYARTNGLLCAFGSTVVVCVAALSTVVSAKLFFAHACAVKILYRPFHAHVRLSRVENRIGNSDRFAGASAEIFAARISAFERGNWAACPCSEALDICAGHWDLCIHVPC